MPQAAHATSAEAELALVDLDYEEAARLFGEAAALVSAAELDEKGALLLAVTAIAAHDLPVSPAVIRRRAAFIHAVTAGQAASEFEPRGQAAAEIIALYRWLADLLWPGTKQRKRERRAA
jgi:hypothetical protein